MTKSEHEYCQKLEDYALALTEAVKAHKKWWARKKREGSFRYEATEAEYALWEAFKKAGKSKCS